MNEAKKQIQFYCDQNPAINRQANVRKSMRRDSSTLLHRFSTLARRASVQKYAAVWHR